MDNASEYFLQTENSVRLLLQGAASYRAKVQSIQRKLSRFEFVPDAATPRLEFSEWWIENKNDKNALLQACRKYATEAFSAGLLAGNILKFACRAIEFYSENTAIPDEWTKIFNERFLPRRYFVGRLVHEIPVGLLVYCGLNQYMNAGSRNIQNISHEVFSRLGTYGGHFEFQAFVERPSEYRDMHFEYLAASVVDILGWNSYDQYIHDMQQALLV